MSIYDYDEEEVRMVVARDMAEEMAEEMAVELAEKNELISKIKLVIKKVKKEKSVALIADELEEEESDIKPVYDAVIRSAPEYNVDDIIKELQEIDLGTMTPIDGLNYLYKLQNQLKNRWQ